MTATATIPGSVVDFKESDLAAPTNALVTSLHLESEDKENGRDLIKADALDLTKGIAGLVGAGGALSGALAGVAAWLVNEGQEPLKIALAATAGLIIAVTIAVVGWVTVTDVRSRAQTQQARYDARTKVVHDYFGLVDDADLRRESMPIEVRMIK